ncbi:MAG: AAA family ATPase [Oceanicaulis sp.]|nr:AAA family ATPase [Oceanicaulis sp.]
MKQVAIFNHKGGVAKTTTSFHLAWMLVELGNRVMLVDCDPQCNLTGVCLGEFEGEDYPFESSDPKHPRNIRDAVRPAFESRPYGIASVELYELEQRPGLFLLPGHVGLAEFESQLAVAHELSNTLSALQNVPGAIRYAIQKTATENKIDIVIVDLSPSLGALNQNVFMTSESFIIPMAPDLFSSMALSSLSRILPKWSDWAVKAASNSILREADYPFPDIKPKYLGSTVSNFRKRARGDEEAKPTKAFQAWFDRLKVAKEGVLIKALGDAEMLLPDEVYAAADADPNAFLMEIASFDSLIATAQELAKPVFAITREDTETRGRIADNHETKIEDVKGKYKDGALRVVELLKSV